MVTAREPAATGMCAAGCMEGLWAFDPISLRRTQRYQEVLCCIEVETEGIRLNQQTVDFPCFASPHTAKSWRRMKSHGATQRI
jgi:hypothetical protein